MMARNFCSKWTFIYIVKVFLMCFHSIGGYETKHNYGIVIDAGSSGSRVRVYKWEPRLHVNHVPYIREIFSDKISPGISDFAKNLNGLESYIKGLLSKAKKQVPVENHKDTPIYLMATAGMRLLLEHHANSVIAKIDDLLQNQTINPFKYAHINTRILSGEEEGVFAWITANYLGEFFDNPENMKSAGILEMGGASTQIAFMHSASILADKFPVTIAGNIYPLYVHSYLSFGQNHLEERIREDLYEMDMGLEKIDNPCMLRGDVATYSKVMGINKNLTFVGTGDPTACLNIIDNIVYKVQDKDHCSPKPCAIGSVYQPSIKNQTFYALSAFSFSLNTLDVVENGDDTFSPAETLESAFEYCTKHIDVIRKEPGKHDYDFLSTECMMGLYIPTLLVKGYGFSNTTRQLKAVKEIKNHTIDWPLGAILYENERRDWTCVLPTSLALSASGYVHGGLTNWTIVTAFIYQMIVLYSLSR